VLFVKGVDTSLPKVEVLDPAVEKPSPETAAQEVAFVLRQDSVTGLIYDTLLG
jgi:hypothetical protein